MLADQGVPLCLEKAATPLRSALLKRSISASLWWRVNPKTGVPDSLPATPKSPPTRRVPPRGLDVFLGLRQETLGSLDLCR